MKTQILMPLIGVLSSHALVAPAAEEISYERLKGAALKEVLRSIPPKEPAEALRSLEVIDGFAVEFVAHEPLVLDPVAAAIDENGLMYVAEDADYPYKPGPGERPKGRIRVLKDNDGDGFYEESHLFANDLLWPAGVALWKGGVFVAAPPDIWYLKDTNGDLKADSREKCFTGFGTGGSQYILNNLQWGLDHKIYAAVAGNGGLVARADHPEQTPVSVSRKDFRFDPVTREFESISGGKQFGNTFDDWGNRFLCTQDTAAYQVVFPQHYLERNPLLSVPESTKRLVAGGAPIFRISPIEAWRAIRSSRRLLAQKGAPDESGVSHHVLDGVAGVTVYRGGAFPEQFYGNVFCGDAQNNLVHRRSLASDGVLFRSERFDQSTEFLRSTDNWFRPVNFVNAPDGTLYILDLSREVLEAVHIPMDVVSHLDLTSGRDRGRIYRVVPKGFTRPAQPRLGDLTTVQLVACLESPHAWWRETAHRLLYERKDMSAEAPLRRLLRKSSLPQARLHALWSLEGLKALSDRELVSALSDLSPAVREHSLQLAEPRLNRSSELLTHCLKLAADSNPRVRFQLAFTLGETSDPRAASGLATIAKRDAADYFIRTAILSSSYHRSATLTVELLKDARFALSGVGTEMFQELARFAGARNRQDEIPMVLSASLKQEQVDLQRAVVIGLSDGLRFSGGQLSSWTKSIDAVAKKRFDDLIDRAVQIVADTQADGSQLKLALRLLESAADERATEPVLGLLDRLSPVPIQVAAIRTLSSLNPRRLPEILLDHWRAAGPGARREILAALLTNTDRITALLEAVENGHVAPGEVDALSRSALVRHADLSVRRRAVGLWGEEQSGARNEIMAKYRPALELKGQAETGRTTFERLCAACHRLSGLGTEVGPNLALAATRSPEELLTHILDPNREVNPAFVQYTIDTTDGDFVSGLMVADSPTSVTLKGVNFQKTIPRGQIKKLASDGQSLMPVGLEQGLSFQDVADLLSFLTESQYDFGTSGQSFSRDVPER